MLSSAIWSRAVDFVTLCFRACSGNDGLSMIAVLRRPPILDWIGGRRTIFTFSTVVFFAKDTKSIV